MRIAMGSFSSARESPKTGHTHYTDRQILHTAHVGSGRHCSASQCRCCVGECVMGAHTIHTQAHSGSSS
jgi:hypothetical protein